MTNNPSANDTYIAIENVTFRRDTRVIFDNISCQIQRGKITALMGPSGTGKTTLLRLISGQLRPDAGKIYVDGVDIHSLSNRALYQLRRQMGMLFQNGALFTNLTVFENVAFPLREHTRLPEHMIRDLVLMKLQAVGLRGAIHLMPSQLSGGMARRVALARTIALDPSLLMYDEPFAGQDPISMGVLVKLIKDLSDSLNLTSIIVSHDVAETASIADYIYVVSDAHLIGQGSAEELMHDQTPAVKQFIRGLPDGVVPFHYPARDYAEDLLHAE
ncbi:MAG: ATP-binding cassette domain-containing protein [Gammaproteobacteria bacterium]